MALLINFFSFSLLAQNTYLLKDKNTLAIIDSTVKSIYRFEFTKAKKYHAIVTERYPNHPVVFFNQGMILYYSYFPFEYKGKVCNEFIALMEEANRLAEERVKIDKNDIEGAFFRLMSRSMIMRVHSDHGEYKGAVTEAMGIYKLIKKGFELKESWNEFYLTTGIYNCYRIYYPEKYPVYKAFTWFFQDGDKKKGVEQLEYCAKNAIFTSTEASIYLAGIMITYENNPQKALAYISELHDKYPYNIVFMKLYTEILLLNKKYEEAIPYIEKLTAYSYNSYYNLAGLAYGAIVDIAYYKKNEQAKIKLDKAEQLIETLGTKGKNCKGYVYTGLYIYYKQANNTVNAKKYYELAKEHDYRNSMLLFVE